MKRLLILLSASIAITYSFVSRADAATRLVTVVPAMLEYNISEQQLVAIGYLPNPCTELIRPVFVSVAENTVMVEFVAEFSGAFCVAVPGAQFQLNVTAADIKNEIFNLGLNTEAQYRVVSPYGEEVAVIDLSSIDAWDEYVFQPMQNEIFPAQKSESAESYL